MLVRVTWLYVSQRTQTGFAGGYCPLTGIDCLLDRFDHCRVAVTKVASTHGAGKINDLSAVNVLISEV